MTFVVTDQHRVFVQEYLVDFNATQAALRAGYKDGGGLRANACRLLARPEIQELVQEAVNAHLKSSKLTAERVDAEIARLAFSDVRGLYNPDGSLKMPHEWDDDTAAAVSSIEVTEVAGMPMAVKKSKLHGKVEALNLAAKRLGLLTEKLSIGGSEELPPISIEEAARRVAFTLAAGMKAKRDNAVG